jgi:hypothetical protein
LNGFVPGPLGKANTTHTTGFKVMELGGGNSSAHFAYRVVAKRKGYEKTRLEAAEDPGSIYGS